MCIRYLPLPVAVWSEIDALSLWRCLCTVSGLPRSPMGFPKQRQKWNVPFIVWCFSVWRKHAPKSTQFAFYIYKSWIYFTTFALCLCVLCHDENSPRAHMQCWFFTLCRHTPRAPHLNATSKHKYIEIHITLVWLVITQFSDTTTTLSKQLCANPPFLLHAPSLRSLYGALLYTYTAPSVTLSLCFDNHHLVVIWL